METFNCHRRKRSHGPEPLSYLAVLNISQDATSMFSIVETNVFKHLTHLSLPFQAGNDDAVKRYLAARLCQRNSEKIRMNKSLTEALEQLKHFKETTKQLEKTLEDLERKHSIHISEETIRFTEQLHSQVGGIQSFSQYSHSNFSEKKPQKISPNVRTSTQRSWNRWWSSTKMRSVDTKQAVCVWWAV